jgi:hypothetical protein
MSPRKSYTAEAHEVSYATWRQCGQNIEATVRELRKKGYLITKPTLCDWRDKFTWCDRAARAEAEEQKAGDAKISSREKALVSLRKRLQSYDDYLDSLPAGNHPDNQALFAYTNLVKTIGDIEMKAQGYKATAYLDFMRDLVDWLGKNDEEGLACIERDLDDFTAWAREKYAA